MELNPNHWRYRKTVTFRESVLAFLTGQLESLGDVEKAWKATRVEFHLSKRTIQRMLDADKLLVVRGEVGSDGVEKVGGEVYQKRHWRDRHKELAIQMVEAGGETMLEDPWEFAPELVKQGATVLKGLGEYNADQPPGTLVAILNHVNNLPAEFKAEFFGDKLGSGQGRVLPATAEGADGPAIPGKQDSGV